MESGRNLTQVAALLSTTPGKCHRTTLWNAEPIYPIEVILFHQKVDGLKNSRSLCCI